MSFVSKLIGVLMAAAAVPAAAAPPAIVTQGKGAAIACASCHGMEGAGNSAGGYPALAQMPSGYFTKQIADFKSGTRSNPVMTPIAKALSPEDAEDAANYYATQIRMQSPSAPADAGLIARGEKLANNGAWDRGVPACFKCHAPGGIGVAPSFPPLAGQHVVYTLSQLEAWKKGARNNDPLQLMKTVTEKLSDDDMRAVAAYVATLGAPNVSAQNAPATTASTASTATPAAPSPATPVTPTSSTTGKTATPSPAPLAPLTPTPATKKPATQEKTK